MEYTLEKDTLTMYLTGELNAYTSESTEKEIDDIISKNTFNALVFDLKDLNYISSAGLRIVVKLKKEYDNFSIINVPDFIYDIFVMVGFHKLMKIEKLG